MIYAMAVLVLFQYLGYVLSSWLGIPVPAPLMGMALLLLALCVLRRLPASLGKLSIWLVGHLMLLFIPAVAGIMTQTERISAEWLPFLAASMGGVAITLVATAATLRFMMKRQRGQA